MHVCPEVVEVKVHNGNLKIARIKKIKINHWYDTIKIPQSSKNETVRRKEKKKKKPQKSLFPE